MVLIYNGTHNKIVNIFEKIIFKVLDKILNNITSLME
ncbi:hypothetical protein P343_05960 [Sporolactobacillus laevolacticus DSM 442]|uniref:Uncharacterized protein n=1 Tax=Sporolactobacillus laevolacticus DSM 442 TaxID=1395513 RepID=V6J0U5_9BACL|nr:hypothetical protein P343_05960 [Sporolactobacillus laevolacticus DSM 442]